MTSIKSLCQDEIAAEQFALYLAQRVQQQINDVPCPSNLTPEECSHKTLIVDAIAEMERYLQTPTHL